MKLDRPKLSLNKATFHKMAHNTISEIAVLMLVNGIFQKSVFIISYRSRLVAISVSLLCTIAPPHLDNTPDSLENVHSKNVKDNEIGWK